MSSEAISNLSREDRHFDPPEDLAADANLKADAYDDAADDRLGFWAKQAERISWATPFDEVLDWSNAPFAKWYVGGRLNAAYNCVDRHVEEGNGDRVAFHFVGEPEDDTRDITYSDLKDEVSQAANALIELGVETGDRVAIYMPMIPETIVAMLACARLGAPHTVVFGGFSSDALSTRVADCEAKVIITADGGYRRGEPSALKPAVDEAVGKLKDDGNDIVEHVLVVRRTGEDVEWDDDRDVWWHETVEKASTDHTPEDFDSEHPLYVMYTSGTTGKPKGILHTTGGYLVQLRLLVLGRLRPQARRHLLVHRRRRLGHRALLHRVRTARVRRDAGALRRHARHPAQGPLVGDHPGQGRHEVLHRAHRDPHLHEVGRGDPRRSSTCRHCASSARSVSRSTPRRTSGTARTSAAARRRSSTPGGRPRPAHT